MSDVSVTDIEAGSAVKTTTAEFEVVRVYGPGRPLFLTPRRFIRICRLIEQGESASEACRTELVTYRGFRLQVRKRESYERRLKEAEETREHFLREYHIANIRKHAPKNVLASLWWLERRYPSEFALRTVNRNLNSSEALIGDQVSEDQLRRYSELMEDFAREKRGEQAALPAPEQPLNGASE